jgi:hypothetical protein
VSALFHTVAVAQNVVAAQNGTNTQKTGANPRVRPYGSVQIRPMAVAQNGAVKIFSAFPFQKFCATLQKYLSVHFLGFQANISHMGNMLYALIKLDLGAQKNLFGSFWHESVVIA